MSAIAAFTRMLRDEKGATAIEYGLIAGLIVLAIVGGMKAFANEAITMWNLISDEVQNAGSDTGDTSGAGV